jgi:putative ubiquitin-RnfH superfamily antitoxin RatB of RatAB toxin-antitoxin module
MDILVVYALRDRQHALPLQLPVGARVADAIAAVSGDPALADVDWAEVGLGVWGQRVDGEQKLEDGDRVEIYRPLRVDPKALRRTRAEAQRGSGSQS